MDDAMHDRLKATEVMTLQFHFADFTVHARAGKTLRDRDFVL